MSGDQEALVKESDVMEEESLSEKADKVSVDMGETQALVEKEELEEKGDEEKNEEMRLDMEETEEKAHEKVDEGKSEEVKIDMEVTEEKAREKNVDGESYGKLVEELRHQFVEGEQEVDIDALFNVHGLWFMVDVGTTWQEPRRPWSSGCASWRASGGEACSLHSVSILVMIPSPISGCWWSRRRSYLPP